MKIKPLSEFDFGYGGKPGGRMRVCIVSSEFLGPVKNSGIGTVTSALAKQLAVEGHEVTLLYTYVGFGKPATGDKPWSHWVELLALDGILLDYIQHDGHFRAWREASWRVKEFIAEGSFDVVYFNDHYGSGYYALLAKRHAIAPFCDQIHCVITHGAMEWVFNINDYYATRLNDVEWMGLERRSVEMADVVIGPSAYLLGEYEKYGWRLPAQTFHQPYPILKGCVKIQRNQRLPVTEIVFFGRLEVRKGLWLFCEALDGLINRFPAIDVTFLGRATEFSGISSALQIVNRVSKWPFRVRLFSDFDRDQAVSYLRKPGRLAVMPALADNSPCAVYECIEAGIPFITTRGSGIEEIVDKTCWDDILVQPNVISLKERLAYCLENGAVRGLPAFDPAENLATWSAWHRFLTDHRQKLLEAPVSHSAPRSFHGSSKAALVFVVDSGDCTLSLFIDNLSSHISRFGKRAAYLVLSSRRGDVHNALQELFNKASDDDPIPIFIVDSSAIDEVRNIICASEFVFFVDAETEILTPFFIAAIERLREQERAIVSCAVALRRDRGERAEIGTLPTGDLPGLAAIGEPLGGSVWAITGTSFAAEVSALRFYDAQLDSLASSSVLGQLLMQQCRIKGVPIYLLPTVGAVETREGGAEPQSRTMNDFRQAAVALDIKPSVYEGGPAWYAISTLGAYVGSDEFAPVQCSSFLPSTHPFRCTEIDREKPDLPALAAALGRAELSLQLEGSTGPRPGHLRHLIDVSTRAIRLAPAWDLRELFTRGGICEFGLTLLPSAPERRHPQNTEASIRQSVRHLASDPETSVLEARGPTPKDLLSIPLPPGPGRVYLDASRLHIDGHIIQAVASLRLGGPGRIFIVDIPLCGQNRLVARLRSTSTSDPLLAVLRAIDQKEEGAIGTASARIVANTPAELSIDLHQIYGRATIAFEFSGAEKMDLAIESLRIV